jgi:hypothetical protein
VTTPALPRLAIDVRAGDGDAKGDQAAGECSE